jgi:protein TonB
VGTSSGDLQVFEGIRASVLVESGEGIAVAATVPHYPAGLAEAGVEGMVILRVAVSAEGRATEVRVEKSSGHVTLDDAAMARVREWRFTPATKDGAPVAGEVLVPVEFRADDELAAGE